MASNTTLTSRVNALETLVNNLSATVVKQAATITTLQKTIDTQDIELDSLRNAVDDLKNPPPPPPPPPDDKVTVVKVPVGGDVQAAVDAAVAAKIPTEIRVAVQTIKKHVVLRARAVDSPWITIRPDVADDIFVMGVKPWVVPEKKLSMLVLQAPDNSPVLTAEDGANHYKLFGIEVPPNPSVSMDLVVIGNAYATKVEQLPSYITFDHCYFHGDPTRGQFRGLQWHVANGIVTCCYFDDFFENGRQSQAIYATNGPGPYLIEKSYICAASENILFGGDDPRVPNLIPSKITIRGNYICKNLAWKTRTDVQFNIANLLEFKLGRDVDVYDNVFQFNWPGAQAGAGIVPTVRNQNATAPWSTIENLHFHHNVILDVNGPAVNSLGKDDQLNNTVVSVQGKNLVIDYNLFVRCRNGIQVNKGFEPTIIRHNTFTDCNDWFLQFPTAMAANNFVYEGNVTPCGAYGITGNNTTVGKPTLDVSAPGYSVTKNVVGKPTVNLPAGNYTVPDLTLFFDARKRYIGTELAPDGAKVGADIDDIIARIPWATW
jgi:hypothetical protein